MHPVEIDRILKTFTVCVDSREQDTERSRKRYERFGVEFSRAKLNFGDYTYNFLLPNGQQFFEIDKPINPLYALERKMNLDELASCFTRDRKRFTAEFERAKAAGAVIDLLVENATWENLLNGKYRSKFSPKAFEASISAFRIRYGMNIIFCKEETSGELIKEFLYRDLKERLTKGEFDEAEV